MAAAQATIETMLETDGIAHLDRIGSALRAGWQQAADSHGVGIRQTGPVSIPLMLFDGDDFATRNVAARVPILRRAGRAGGVPAPDPQWLPLDRIE